MSEQQTENTEASETPAVGEHLHLPDDHPLVKTLAEQKRAIKDLKARAARLDEIEESQKSEADRAAERLTKAEQRAAEAEARAVRREVALEHGLSKDDAALLDGVTDEDAMRRLAARLADQQADRKKNGNRVPREGTNTKPSDSDERAFVRGLFGGS